jgi:predicted nucleic acid-binding Zn ribbon protein
MGSYSIGEALNLLLERSHWKPKVVAVRMSDEWEAITGKTIAKYTRSINMFNKTLTIYTDVAPLKQELQMGREQLIVRINEYFGEQVVDEIVIK